MVLGRYFTYFGGPGRCRIILGTQIGDQNFDNDPYAIHVVGANKGCYMSSGEIPSLALLDQAVVESACYV